MKTSLIFIAPGFEEIEALATADVLHRAGMPLTLVAVAPTLSVTGANGITVQADVTIDNLTEEAPYEWLIAPGGMPGASNLAANETVCRLLTEQYKSGGKVAAICAAPAVVLGPLGILDGRAATSYPGFEEMFPASVTFTGERVTALPTLITGNGPGSAIPFALAIVANSCGENAAQELAAGMMCS